LRAATICSSVKRLRRISSSFRSSERGRTAIYSGTVLGEQVKNSIGYLLRLGARRISSLAGIDCSLSLVLVNLYAYRDTSHLKARPVWYHCQL